MSRDSAKACSGQICLSKTIRPGLRIEGRRGRYLERGKRQERNASPRTPLPRVDLDATRLGLKIQATVESTRAATPSSSLRTVILVVAPVLAE